MLPLVNQTGDAARDHVADDLTDRLATALSRFSGTTVIAPGTAFTFKGKAVDARRIGDELAVRYVIEGSVRQQDARTVLSVRLVHCVTEMAPGEFAAMDRRTST